MTRRGESKAIRREVFGSIPKGRTQRLRDRLESPEQAGEIVHNEYRRRAQARAREPHELVGELGDELVP